MLLFDFIFKFLLFCVSKKGVLHSVELSDIGVEKFIVELKSNLVACHSKDFLFVVNHSTKELLPRCLSLSICDLNGYLLHKGKNSSSNNFGISSNNVSEIKFSGYEMIGRSMEIHSDWLLEMDFKKTFESLAPRYVWSNFVLSVQLILLLLTFVVCCSSILLWDFQRHKSVFYCEHSPLFQTTNLNSNSNTTSLEVLNVATETQNEKCGEPGIQLALFHGLCGVIFVALATSFLHSCHSVKPFLKIKRFKMASLIILLLVCFLITIFDEFVPNASYIWIGTISILAIWFLCFTLGPRLRHAIHNVHQQLPTQPPESHVEGGTLVVIPEPASINRSENNSPVCGQSFNNFNSIENVSENNSNNSESNNNSLVIEELTHTWAAPPNKIALSKIFVGVVTIAYCGIILPYYRSTSSVILKIFFRIFLHPLLTLTGLGVLRTLALVDVNFSAVQERVLPSILFLAMMELCGTFFVLTNSQNIGLLIALVFCAAFEQFVRRWFAMRFHEAFYRFCSCNFCKSCSTSAFSSLQPNSLVDLICQMSLEHRSSVAFQLCYSVLVPISIYLFWAHRLVFDLGYSALLQPNGVNLAISSILLFFLQLLERLRRLRLEALGFRLVFLWGVNRQQLHFLLLHLQRCL